VTELNYHVTLATAFGNRDCNVDRTCPSLLQQLTAESSERNGFLFTPIAYRLDEKRPVLEFS